MKFRDLVSSEEGFQVVKSLVEALIQDARVSITYIKSICIKRVSRLIQLVKFSQHVVPRSSQKQIEHGTKDSSWWLKPSTLKDLTKKRATCELH